MVRSDQQNASNADIKSSLGLGIVRFEEQPEDPVITIYDYEYRVNTEVITAVDVSGGQSDPDNPARVTFTIDGRDYHVDNVYYPEGDSQLAWVRWTTPDTPQDMVITVRVSGPGNAQGTINCKIVGLDQNPPPNPVADDRNDSFTPSSIPSREQKPPTTGRSGVPGGMSIGYGMGMMRMAIGVITAGGSLIWTVIVPAFPPPCASHQTIRIPLLAAEA